MAMVMRSHSDYKRRWWLYRITRRFWPFHNCARWHYDGQETRCTTCGSIFARGTW